MSDGLLFVERANELVVCGKAKGVYTRSRSESESEQGVQSQALDPKLGELTMARLKVR